MNPDHIADLLLSWQRQLDFDRRVKELAPYLTLAVIEELKKRADAQLFSHPNLSLQIARIAWNTASILAMPEAQALAAWMLGNGFNLTNRYSEAIKAYKQAEAFYADQGRLLETARLWANQAGVHVHQGEYQITLELADKARTVYSTLGLEAQPFLPALEMNIGVAYKHLGDFAHALAAYERGRCVCLALGNVAGAARFDLNCANVLEQMDRLAEAEPLYQRARQTLEQNHYQADVARADLNLGLLAWHRGEYQMALRYLEMAHQGYAAAFDLTEVAVVNLYCSFVYSNLNFLEEAIELASRAEKRLKRRKARAYRAMALEILGLAYQRLEMYEIATQKLTLARNIFRRQGARTRVALLDLRQAQLALEIGEVERAIKLAKKVEMQIDPAILPERAAQLQLLLAQCALRQDDMIRAEHCVQAALGFAEQHGLPEVATAFYLAGQVSECSGNDQAALAHYEQAIQCIEHLKILLALDEFQMGFMDDKLPIYMAAARLCQRAGLWAQTLYLLNLAQLAPLPRAAGSSKADTQLYELRATWRWYQSRLEKAEDSDALVDSPSDLVNWRKKQRELEHQIADLTYRRRADMPMLLPAETTPDLSIAPGFVAQLQSHLRPNEAFLHYYIIDNVFCVLLLSRDALHYIPNLVPAANVERLLNAWRYYVEHLPVQQTEAWSVDARLYLARMYQALVAPLDAQLSFCTHLFLTLPPAYHDLPWAAFYDGQGYLVERFELTHLSAPAALLRADMESTRDVSDLSSALIVGYSDHGRLPYAPAEARQIAATLGERRQPQLLVEAEATLEQVRRQSQSCRLLHLATHAVFRADNPLFSWARLADGDLTVNELGELHLPARPLVVLSACETGRGRPRGGGLLGMGRGFLAAGASGLVVSLWKVADQASARLCVDFYDQYAFSPAAALRQAQLAALAGERHPYFWAGFIFVGG